LPYYYTTIYKRFENARSGILLVVLYYLKLSTEPRFGSFGTGDDPASDFLFVAK
jgi:hypothetical protein